jgi:hypothetical protein
MAVFGASTCVFGSESGDEGQEGDKATVCKAAIVGYAANFQSFTFCRCRYQITNATAKTYRDAVDGRWINAQTTDFRLLRDEGKELIECLAPPPVLKRNEIVKINGSIGMFRSGYTGESYLSDGEREMNYCKGLKSISLFKKNVEAYAGNSSTPFTMSAMGPNNILGPDRLAANSNQWEANYIGLETADGKPAIAIGFRDKLDVKYGQTRQFYLDPARGFLPARIDYHCRFYRTFDGQPKIQTILMQGRECSKQRWFPERSLNITVPENDGGEFRVVEIKVVELDVDTRPSVYDFTVEVPVRTPVWDQNNPAKGFFRLKQDERINVNDLPRLFEMLENVKSTPLMDTAVAHPRSILRTRTTGIIVGLVLIGAGVLVAMRRRARRG